MQIFSAEKLHENKANGVKKKHTHTKKNDKNI